MSSGLSQYIYLGMTSIEEDEEHVMDIMLYEEKETGKLYIRTNYSATFHPIFKWGRAFSLFNE